MVVYTYDAVGRLVKEGERTYEYGWLDKVMRVAEDGKDLARFEYHNNNQLAKAIRGNDIETFEWDGLALIERNGTKYINEPHPGGGNPVLAIGGKDTEATETIFTDMLGTSLGKIEENRYSAIAKTSFGADTSDKSSFFTGKPYVEELGYAFLFRNYRPNIGKWQISDIIGYPDGWNNFAYCGNNVIHFLDYIGTVVLDLRSYGYPVIDKPGSFVLVAHGSENIGYPIDQRNPINPKVLSPQETYDIIKNNGYKDGMDIYLLVCEAGKEDFADELAKLTKSKVHASKKDVIIRDGKWDTKENKFEVHE